eukprot:15344054-Ditylum_brightwellii.AAC.1
MSAPNTKKGTNYYKLRHNKDHHSPEEMNIFTTKVIGSKAVKEHFKRAFGLADREGRHDNKSDDDSISDDRSNYKIDDTAFLEGETIDRVDKESDGEEEIN